MQRFFIYCSYDGSAFCGWQIQPDAPTVQQHLQDGLKKVLRQTVEVVGCGRTDTGVHARGYFAQFDLEGVDENGILRAATVQDTKNWVYRLNAVLDRAVAVHGIFEVAPDFHCRYSALRRTYHYYIHTEKNPFLDTQSYYCYKPFNVESIREAAAKLTSYSDFTSFSKLHTQTKDNICRLTRAEFNYLGQNRWVFVFTANRFLRNMVRAMVGTLLDVGFGRLKPEDLDAVMQAKDRCKAGNSMPPQGLFLESVEYF